MRTAEKFSESSPPGADPRSLRDSDLTARARIRDAAIECFATEGFRASVRTIAARANVSPGLITHHFGSKHALREECDDEVLRRYRDNKANTVTTRLSGFFENLEARGKEGSILLVYILRSIQVGGPAARTFVDHLIDDARGYMAEGVANGMLKPSRDEEARLRYLAYQTLGALLIQFTLNSKTSPEDFAKTMYDQQVDTILPTLELFTEGVFTTSDALDQYLAVLKETKNGDRATTTASAIANQGKDS